MVGRGRGGPGLQEEDRGSDCHPPGLWGVCWEVSLSLPQVSSDGDCILLGLLLSGQGWS